MRLIRFAGLVALFAGAVLADIQVVRLATAQPVPGLDSVTQPGVAGTSMPAAASSSTTPVAPVAPPNAARRRSRPARRRDGRVPPPRASKPAAMRRAEIDRLAIDREMAAARVQVLQAQIEPHFLFNTLANVRCLYQTDAAAGREMLDNLMRYLEAALPRMRGERTTLAQESSLIAAYLDVQKIRMGRRLAYAIDFPAALAACTVPPMMLLTLVENALEHGLGPLPEGGMIRLDARLDDDVLVLRVADSGRGFGEGTSGTGIGLSNVRSRLEAMFGERAGLELAGNLPRGVTATLRLPAQGVPARARGRPAGRRAVVEPGARGERTSPFARA